MIPTGTVAAAVFAAALVVLPAAADEPWIISSPVVITEPAEIGHVILLSGGSLTVRDVPEPGLRVSGHIWAVGDSEVDFENSVIRFMSTYHGQYALVGAERASIRVSGCDYRVPFGVQHALLTAGSAELVVEDTDFGEVQLISSDDSTFAARRLTGSFEVIVQNDSEMVLEDIPRVPDEGRLWVWVEFPDGSEAEYTPPMPGFIDHWSFPPPGARGIFQTIALDRCETLLWPMLVREGSRVTLRDVPEDNWVVVGFHLPNDAVIRDLVNGRSYDDATLDLADRTFRVVDASVDTWNFYPQASAHVSFFDSAVGEILAMEDSRVRMERTEVDGSGGFFGARDRSRIVATGCRFTCTIEASQESVVELHSSSAEPHPADPTGEWTRLGAYDDARLLVSQTAVSTTPVLGGRGLIAVSSLDPPPLQPPAPGESQTLAGTNGLYCLDPEVGTGGWRLEVSDRSGGPPEVIAAGSANLEDEEVGIWSDADPAADHRLQTSFTDGLGRVLVGNLVVPGSGPRVR
jgi:hypothetical protein